jgi:hypothetical protein
MQVTMGSELGLCQGLEVRYCWESLLKLKVCQTPDVRYCRERPLKLKLVCQTPEVRYCRERRWDVIWKLGLGRRQFVRKVPGR